MKFDEYLTEEMETDRMNGGSSDDREEHINEQFSFYERFIEWLTEKSDYRTDLVARKDFNDAWIDTREGKIWLNKFGAFASSDGHSCEAWNHLRSIWQKEIV